MINKIQMRFQLLQLVKLSPSFIVAIFKMAI